MVDQPAALPRSATIIPLPRGAARCRQVLTYPVAIAVPPRCPDEDAAKEQPLAAPYLCLPYRHRQRFWPSRCCYSKFWVDLSTVRP